MSKYPLTVEGVPLIHQGKTRDTFATNDPNKLLVVASDRLSTHNVVHESSVPLKGRVLTALTIHWAREVFDRVGVEHHLIASGDRIGEHLLPGKYPDDITQRAIVVERLMMLLIEFIYRGYLAGSLYDKFYKLGIENPYGVELEPRLPLMHRFKHPIFTPTDKSEDDDPLSAHDVGKDHPIAAPLGNNVYRLLREHVNARGLELVDTKFEMGINTRGRIVMADEYGTPDSSRFARLAEITEGKPPPWFDKQFFRDIAEHMWGTGPKTPLEFSGHTLESGTRVYLGLFEMAVGSPLSSFNLNYHR